MTDALHIEVLQSDIDEGMAANCESCPVALAAQRALGIVSDETRWLSVGRDRIELVEAPPIRWIGRWSLPQSAQDFISAFDGPVDEPEVEPVPVYPFSFVAEPVA